MAHNTLTEAEKTFFLRMAPHIEAGLSFEQAGRSVLADDARLVDAALASDGCDAIHGYTFTLAVSTSRAARGGGIRSELAGQVYRSLRGA